MPSAHLLHAGPYSCICSKDHKRYNFLTTGSKLCHEAKGCVDASRQGNGKKEPGFDQNRGVLRGRENGKNTVRKIQSLSSFESIIERNR